MAYPQPYGLDLLAQADPTGVLPDAPDIGPPPAEQPNQGLAQIGQRLDQSLGNMQQVANAVTLPTNQPNETVSTLLRPYQAAIAGSPTVVADNNLADRVAQIKGVQPGQAATRGRGGANGLLSLAKTQIGVPYVFGSENPQGPRGGQGQAFDCSGFTKWLFSRTKGVELPHQALQQARVTGSNLGRNQLRPGDLVYFSYGRLGPGAIDHVMVYMGNGKAIGAQPSSNGVGIQPMNWSAFVGGGRI